MKIIVNNGRCTIQRGKNIRWHPTLLPLENVAHAHMRYGFIACITTSGQCQIFSQKGEHVHTYHFNDTRSAEIVGQNKVAVVRSRGWKEIYDFQGFQLSVLSRWSE